MESSELDDGDDELDVVDDKYALRKFERNLEDRSIADCCIMVCFFTTNLYCGQGWRDLWMEDKDTREKHNVRK